MARRDTNFYYSFFFLPPRKRRAILAVWDFCRAVDDAVDEEAASADRADARQAASAEIAKWRRELAACFEGQPVETEQARNLMPVIAAFNLPRRPFEAVIDGVEMDIDGQRYATFDDLKQYCLRVASAVGLICIEIFGYRDAACREYALDLGVALQITNIIRDLGKDLAIGRLYLPKEDLARFGVTEAELRAAGAATGPIRQLLEHEAGRAREFYRRASLALPQKDRRSLVAARIMGAIYFDLLRRIEHSGYNVFGPTIRAPRWRKAVLAAEVWARTAVGLPVEPRRAGRGQA